MRHSILKCNLIIIPTINVFGINSLLEDPMTLASGRLSNLLLSTLESLEIFGPLFFSTSLIFFSFIAK